MSGLAFTVIALALIAGVFFFAMATLLRELQYVKVLADYLGYDSVVEDNRGEARTKKVSLEVEHVRNEVNGVMTAKDAAWAAKQVRGWQMRVHRLEPSLAFWVDLLRQLGLLFTVVGLGLSMAFNPGRVSDLLGPLGLAVWTTVAGLALSLVLTTQFGMSIAVWADTCEKNIEAWDARRRETLAQDRDAED